MGVRVVRRADYKELSPFHGKFAAEIWLTLSSHYGPGIARSAEIYRESGLQNGRDHALN